MLLAEVSRSGFSYANPAILLDQTPGDRYLQDRFREVPHAQGEEFAPNRLLLTARASDPPFSPAPDGGASRFDARIATIML